MGAEMKFQSGERVRVDYGAIDEDGHYHGYGWYLGPDQSPIQYAVVMVDGERCKFPFWSLGPL